MDILQHKRSEFESDVRLAQLFDGYHSLSQLWIKNVKRNPDKSITKFEPDYVIPICNKCDEQWGNICYFFENSKQMRGYGAIDPPYDALGKYKFAE